jgi:decaprenylphospho-beta-D-erythro-pentofuranosid-2-ulose 2-reductase
LSDSTKGTDVIDAVGNPQSLLLLGGTSEIGLAIALRYARQRPIRVVLAGRPSERLDAAAAQLREVGATVSTLPFDAKKPETHGEVIEKAFADGDIDVSIVAFGLLGDQEQAWTDLALAQELAEVNYVAAVTVGVALADRLRKQGHGSVIALSSAAGERARRSNFVYGSTKAGFDAFYTGLTYALQPAGVKVTVVRPGFVRSKMTEGMKSAPMAQTPDQVAEATVKAVRAGREQVWAPGAMRFVMMVLRHVPRPIFRKLPF